MAQVTLRMNQSAVNRLLKGRGPVQLYVANWGRQVEGEARRRVPVVSGRLKDSIDSELVKTARGEWGCEIFSDEPYASWIEDGKRFDPRSGRIIFVKVGPRPFLRDALRAVGFPRSQRRFF